MFLLIVDNHYLKRKRISNGHDPRIFLRRSSSSLSRRWDAMGEAGVTVEAFGAAILQDSTCATRDMCAHAFSILLARLRPHQREAKFGPIPEGIGGVFVTWSVPRGRYETYALRGCIGTLKTAELSDAVPRYAAHAAFSDPRFDPIASDELPGLKVGVSVLSRFERADDVYDWTVGVHGIILEFGNGRFSATYLPEVCYEHAWSKQYCVQSLAEKAGFSGRLEGHMMEEAVVTRYQSTKAEMTFEEYQQLPTL